MKKFLFAICCIVALVSCDEISKASEVEVKRSTITRIGSRESCRVLFLENGDTLYSESDAAFSAYPGDSVVYRYGILGVLDLTVLFSPERKTLPSKQKVEENNQIFFFPIAN